MTIIQCNRPSKLLIYTVIFLIALIVESYSMEDIIINDLFSSVVLAMFFNLCGVLAIIPERIVHKYSTHFGDEVISKSNENDAEQLIRSIKAVPYDLSKAKGFFLFKNKKNLVIFLYFFVSLIDITTTIAFIYSNSLRWTNSILSFSTEGLQIFISCLFCRIILKYKFELHKKVSLCIILLAMIINLFVSLSYETGASSAETSTIVIRVIMTAYTVSFTAFQEVLEKYMMNNCFQNNFFILFVESTLGEVYAGIILLVVYLYQGASEFGDFLVGKALLFSLGCIPYSNMRLIFGRDFNPTDRIVADKLGNFYFFLYYLNTTQPSKYYIISIVGFAMIIIGSIIYNETIVLKFCNLDRDTTKEIETRKWREHKLLMDDMNDLSQYNVTISEMENDPTGNISIDKEL